LLRRLRWRILAAMTKAKAKPLVDPLDFDIDLAMSDCLDRLLALRLNEVVPVLASDGRQARARAAPQAWECPRCGRAARRPIRA
jgi:hypothetical protein